MNEFNTSYTRSGNRGKKPAILGALMLCLDLINFFLMLLRFTGNRR